MTRRVELAWQDWDHRSGHNYHDYQHQPHPHSHEHQEHQEHHQHARGFPTQERAPGAPGTPAPLHNPIHGPVSYPIDPPPYRVQSSFQSPHFAPHGPSPSSPFPPPGHYYPAYTFTHDAPSPAAYYNHPAHAHDREYPRDDVSPATSAYRYTSFCDSASCSSQSAAAITPTSPASDCSSATAFSCASNEAMEQAKTRMRRAKTVAATVSLRGPPVAVGRTAMDEVMRVLDKIYVEQSLEEKQPTSMSATTTAATTTAKEPNFLQGRRKSSPKDSTAASPSSPRVIQARSARVTKKPAAPPVRFVCEVCGATKAQRGQLQIHMRVHTGERPFPCRFKGCGAAFSQSGNRATHEALHSNKKKFKCRICDRVFGQRGNANAHEKRHMRQGKDQKPFACCLDDCTKRFTELGNLKNHLNKYHKGSIDAWKSRLEMVVQRPEDLTPKEREIGDYLRTIFKNLNKGIAGRGVGRYVTRARNCDDGLSLAPVVYPGPSTVSLPAPRRPHQTLAPAPVAVHVQPPLYRPSEIREQPRELVPYSPSDHPSQRHQLAHHPQHGDASPQGQQSVY